MATGDPLAARIGEAHIDDRPISARLARRLAEAAFGYMGLGPVYLVAAYEPIDNPGDPYDVVPFKDDWAAAERHATLLNTDRVPPRYGVFGPYETGHSGGTSAYTLRTVDLYVHAPPNSRPAEEPYTLSTSEFDSLFWTRAAVEKFAVPYYAVLYSPRFAQKVLDEYESADLAVLGHMPWSEYTVFESSAIQGHQQGPIPVLHYLDENGRWQRKPLQPW